MRKTTLMTRLHSYSMKKEGECRGSGMMMAIFPIWNTIRVSYQEDVSLTKKGVDFEKMMHGKPYAITGQWTVRIKGDY